MVAFWNQMKAEKEAQRKKNNQAARARSAALSSVGMRRTRFGWE
jgi:hypothetical protein